MKLEILEYPDPRLHEISQAVTSFDAKLHGLLQDMAETMYGAVGIGLAAPQVQHPVRAFLIDLGLQEGYEKKLYEFINPRLSDGSGKISFEEGCLSVPGVGETVTRNENITVHFQDRFGKPHKLEAQGLLAVAIQHENDHLDGILFVDRLPPIKRHWVKHKLSRQVTL